MSWTPLRHIDMDRATARHLAALLVVASNGASSEPFENVRSADVEPKKALTLLNISRAENSHESLANVTPQPRASQTVFKTVLAENTPIRLRTLTVRMSAGIHCRRTVRRQSSGNVRRTVGRT